MRFWPPATLAAAFFRPGSSAAKKDKFQVRLSKLIDAVPGAMLAAGFSQPTPESNKIDGPRPAGAARDTDL